MCDVELFFNSTKKQRNGDFLKIGFFGYLKCYFVRKRSSKLFKLFFVYWYGAFSDIGPVGGCALDDGLRFYREESCFQYCVTVMYYSRVSHIRPSHIRIFLEPNSKCIPKFFSHMVHINDNNSHIRTLSYPNKIHVPG